MSVLSPDQGPDERAFPHEIGIELDTPHPVRADRVPILLAFVENTLGTFLKRFTAVCKIL
jgi:hypothetical protein